MKTTTTSLATLAALALTSWLLVACSGAAKQVATAPGDEAAAAAAGAAEAAAVAAGLTKEELVAESYGIGVELYKAGRFADAKDSFLKVLALDSKHALAHYQLARLARGAGEVRDAMDSVNTSLNYDRKAPDAIQLKVALLRDMKRWDEALRFIDESSALFTEQDEQVKKKGFLTDRLALLNARGDFMRVIKDGKSLLLLDPDNAQAMREIGRAYLGLRRPGLARYVFREALSRVPDGRIYFYLGTIEDSKGDYKRAIVNYQKAIELSPELAEAYSNLALLNQDAGNHADAIKNLTRALELRPDLMGAKVNLANSYRHMKDFKKAEATYMDVTQRAPKLADAHYNLGVLYLENEVPGYENEDRFGLAAKSFSTYREIAGSSLPPDDPSVKYIKEAQTLQQQTLEMKEQMRMMNEQMEQEAAAQAAEGASEPDDGSGAVEGAVEGGDASFGADDGAGYDDGGAVVEPATVEPALVEPVEPAVIEPATIEPIDPSAPIEPDGSMD